MNVECTVSSGNAAECFIAQPFQYKYGDHLNLTIFDGTKALTDNDIHDFSVTYDTRMESIPPQLWKQLPRLEQLKLRGVGLTYLHASDFENAWSLHNLTLSYNNLTVLLSMVFSRAIQLTEIYLEANQIQRIQDFAFNGLYQLYFLSLSRNHIVTLTSDIFYGAPHISELHLEHNTISTIEPNVFDIPDLMYLYLGNNQLKTLPDDCFRNTALMILDLQSNELIELGNSIYSPNTIRAINLSYNGKIRDLNITRADKDLIHKEILKYDANIKTLS